MNHQAHEIEHARFLRDWQGFIDRWVTKVVIRRGGGTAADADDVRQTAYMEAYAGYLEWQRLPEAERTGASAEAIVGRHVKDAVVEEWSRLRGVPRNSHARGAGGVLYLRSLLQSDRFDHGFAFRQATRYAA